MTQTTRAQSKPTELARFPIGDSRSLAARRAAFAAQMREMAISDLKKVSERLKGLHAELEQKEGRRWSHYDLAAKMGIRPRTFQSWEGGEVENRNGKGYDKMARFYSRKLGRKITRRWILFGDDEAETPAEVVTDPGSELSELSNAVEAVRTALELARLELLAELGEVRTSQEALRRSLRHAERDEEAEES